MTPIRPNALPVQPTPTPGADAARQAAQKAFFDSAMGRAAPPAAAAQTPQIAPRPSFFTPLAQPVQRVDIRPDPGAQTPSKPLRPGSLLDIRV